jgi:hypothetical protein
MKRRICSLSREAGEGWGGGANVFTLIMEVPKLEKRRAEFDADRLFGSVTLV